MENSAPLSINDASSLSGDGIKLIESWKRPLLQEFSKPYMRQLREFLKEEKRKGKIIFPKASDMFNALNSCALESVKVVILGQDPYHGLGQAHGFCFSVQKGVAIPPSLQNIFKELESDVGVAKPTQGSLENWAKQGVLLLNAVLTVESGRAGSHHEKGWEAFTDQVIRLVNGLSHSVVFLLWGAPAQKKAELITSRHHLVLKSPHPSPLSAYRGFLGNRHFSKTNEFLKSQGLREIDWSLKEL
jgi:uracil-DNA glycosylase